MSLIIGLIFFICFIVFGMKFWEKSKMASILLLVPALLMVVFAAVVTYNTLYRTTPNSVTFTVFEESGKYTVKGTWKQPLDAYRFSTDFIVFYVPDDEEITDVKRKRDRDVKNMDMSGLKAAVKEWLRHENPPAFTPQVFDVKTDKTFDFSFAVPRGVQPEDIQLYYVHAREEPMDALEFWFKEIELRE
ncbi:MAG TPA: hypothetical protein VIG80_15800 [Bacillaceae bacterium]